MLYSLNSGLAGPERLLACTRQLPVSTQCFLHPASDHCTCLARLEQLHLDCFWTSPEALKKRGVCDILGALSRTLPLFLFGLRRGLMMLLILIDFQLILKRNFGKNFLIVPSNQGSKSPRRIRLEG